MFTGIVESLAEIINIENEQGNIHFTFHNSLAHTFKIDQSVSHNGVCLTVVSIDAPNNNYVVTAIAETLQKQILAFEKKMIWSI